MKKFIFVVLFMPLYATGQSDPIDAILKSHIHPDAENPVKSILLYVEDINRPYIYNKGFNAADPSAPALEEDLRFKIASSTKLFVATVILQLIEEEKLSLTDKAAQYLKAYSFLDFSNFRLYRGQQYADSISIAMLLSHRSGLADIFTDRQSEFFNRLLENPQQQYSPQSIVNLYFQFHLNENPRFIPGQGWYYSDMNYVLLGLIIEAIDNQPLHKSIRNRIIAPLNLENTYFEFYEAPTGEGAMQEQFVGPVNFSKLNTSFDWAGGGLVSTNRDLAAFINALFHHELISRGSLRLMTDVKMTKPGENPYGLGIYASEYNGKTYYGHYGFYGSYIGYCPESETVVSYSVGQAMPDFSVYQMINRVLKQVE